MGQNPGKLVLPALKAHMGDWDYYISFMSMNDLAERISRRPQIVKSERLQELLQKELQGRRLTEIEKYLATQKQRFFNSLVIGTSGSDLKWFKSAIGKRPIKPGFSLSEHARNALGFLILDGSEKLFSLDGQHRVEGIRQAILQHPTLKTEQVSVILVKAAALGRYEQDPEGFARTRRVFSTLNRYAKPVTQTEIIALDEDDLAAIVTRRLVNDYDLFTHYKISIRRAKSIPPNDRISVTSLGALYGALDFYFGGLLQGQDRKDWLDYKRFRPDDKIINRYTEQAEELWDTYCKMFPPFEEAKRSRDDQEVAGKYRSEEGGHYLFRPIGLLISVRTVRRLVALENLSMQKAVTRVARIPVELSKDPWTKLIWDPVRKTMFAETPNQRMAEKLAFYSVGGDLAKLGTKKEPVTEETLQSDWAGFLKTEPAKVKLVKYLD